MLDKKLRYAALLGTVAALLSAATTIAPRLANPHVSNLRLDLKTVNYRVRGATLKQIMARLRTDGPVDDTSTVRHALLKWRVEWDWSHVRSKPDYINSTVLFRARTILPRVNSRALTSADRIAWRDYYHHIKLHEHEHLNIALAGARRIAATVTKFPPELPTTEANLRLNKIARDARSANELLDSTTRHGQI